MFYIKRVRVLILNSKKESSCFVKEKVCSLECLPVAFK